MRKGKLVSLLLLLVVAVAMGEIYKWVDESGTVHYGDSPQPETKTETVEIPEGPSQEEVEKAQQRMREPIEQHGNVPDKDSLIEPSDKPPQDAKHRTIVPDNITCFSPVSDLVQEPSAEPFSPIAPTTLTKRERELLKSFFSKIELRGSWRGTITELECWGRSTERNSDPISKIKKVDVKMDADWDTFESRLTLEADITNGHDYIYRFEIGDSLYFNELIASNITARDDNKVEVLTLDQNMVSFFIKRHIPTIRHGATRLRGQILYMEASDRSLKLVELFYLDQILASSRTWVLRR